MTLDQLERFSRILKLIKEGKNITSLGCDDQEDGEMLLDEADEVFISLKKEVEGLLESM